MNMRKDALYSDFKPILYVRYDLPPLFTSAQSELRTHVHCANIQKHQDIVKCATRYRIAAVSARYRA
jgi:hypothetical protein